MYCLTTLPPLAKHFPVLARDFLFNTLPPTFIGSITVPINNNFKEPFRTYPRFLVEKTYLSKNLITKTVLIPLYEFEKRKTETRKSQSFL